MTTLAYVIDLNVNRRHLSEAQRAMVGARLANMELGDNQHSEGVEISTASQGGARAVLNIHRSTVNMANKVLESEIQSLIDMCDEDRLAVSLDTHRRHMTKGQRAMAVTSGGRVR